MAAYFTLIAAESPLAWDFLAYYRGAEAAAAGEAFVGLEPDRGGGEYVYPPIVVLGFVPYLLAGDWAVAFVLHAIVNVVLLAVLAACCLRELDRIGRPVTGVDRALIVAFGIASLYPLVSIGLGQVDPLVALLIAVTFITLEQGRDSIAGVALAGAAIIKLFPAAFGLWFIFRRRWRSIVAATAAGVGGIAASLVLFGWTTNRAYLEFILVDRSRLDAFAEGVSPDFFSITLVRPVAALLPPVPSFTYLLVTVASVGPVLWYVYRRTATRTDRHVAYLATIVGILIALPSTNLNHLLLMYFPLVVLVYTLDAGRPRRWLLVGVAIILVPVQPDIIQTTMQAAVGGALDPVYPRIDAALGVASVALIGAVIILAACVRHAMETDPVAPTLRERLHQLG